MPYQLRSYGDRVLVLERCITVSGKLGTVRSLIRWLASKPHRIIAAVQDLAVTMMAIFSCRLVSIGWRSWWGKNCQMLTSRFLWHLSVRLCCCCCCCLPNEGSSSKPSPLRKHAYASARQQDLEVKEAIGFPRRGRFLD
jgi:hypothetical protein